MKIQMKKLYFIQMIYS